MRRMIAALTGATAAALIVPTLVTVAPASARTAPAAQAAAADPVSALKRHFRTHRGVKLTENTKIVGEGKKNKTIFTRRSGVLEFGKTGLVASDLTTRFDLPAPSDELKGLFTPSRTISLKGVSYTSGGIFAESMPEGKKWLRTRGDTVSLVSAVQQIISTVEPGTLKATLAHTGAKRPGGTWDGTRTTVHSGTITLAELFKVSPAVRTMLTKKPTGRSATLPVTWKIYIGSDQLVRRVVSSYTESTQGLNSTELTYVNDTRYTGWGTKVTVKAPPADQVVEFDELLGDTTQPEDPIGEIFKG
ncbi:MULTISPECIES: hypothetical protein [unclassified Streptosporangium]|uniref:hypothetical protein n=1 Tax=unclassified Streptosporangium TaxID=2632669 RepID=UPI002E2B806D|nr:MULTISPECIES: hypothetical protein [unclassified Streptosporangium]